MPKPIRRKSNIVRGKSAKSWNSWFGRLSPSQQQFLKSYFFHLVFIFFLANYVVVRQLQLTFFAQSCMSREMVATDNRCLYIYGGQVYEKGTRSKPHKNQRCGTDVTSIITSFHIRNMAKYMDPNLVGTICSGAPPAPTAMPTNRPTNTPAPQATATRVPTQPPPAPTATRVPTQPAPTATQRPNQPTNPPQPTSSPRPTATARPNSPTNTPLPTSTRAPNPTATLRLLPTATPRVITQSNPTSTPRIIAQVNPTVTRIPTIQQQPTNPAYNQPANPTITSAPTTNFKPPTSNQRSGFGRYLADSEISNSDPKNATDTEESEANLEPETTNGQPQTSNFITNLVKLSQMAVGASFGLMIITTLAVGIRKLNQKFTKKK